jgi:protein TonB
MASVHRTANLPLPYNLARGPGRSLTYMETFLFNEDYRFQLRTLAPIQ